MAEETETVHETQSENETKIITVFGATGMQGGSVVRALCQEGSKFKVRAVTRHPDGERAQELKDLGTLLCFISLNI